MREFELLEHVYATSRSGGDRIAVGPGDDMAVLRFGGRDLLAAVDQVIAGVHVEPETDPALVGRKAVARSLSDVAAMAARPVAVLATVVLPPDYGSDRARRLFDGMREAGEELTCPLVGGDVAFHRDASHPLACTVTVLAEPGDGPPVLRSGARVGDKVAVTGCLGGAAQTAGPTGAEQGWPHHLTFRPRIDEALELARRLGSRLHAMIDLSDGLGRDALHVAVASGVSIEVEAGQIPCRGGVDWRRAAGDGEDYELLFTASGEIPEVIGEGVPVTIIGQVVRVDGGAPVAADEKERATAATGVRGATSTVLIREGATCHDARAMGWQHES